MAVDDTAFVLSDLLQHPNSVLNAAHPAAGLPRLQSAAFGSAVMGYGDLFVAGVLGGLVARRAGRRLQLRAAALTALVALGFDLLFFAVSELPATVPVALALLALSGELGLRRGQPVTRSPHDGEPAVAEPYPRACLAGEVSARLGGQRLSAPEAPPRVPPPR